MNEKIFVLFKREIALHTHSFLWENIMRIKGKINEIWDGQKFLRSKTFHALGQLLFFFIY